MYDSMITREDVAREALAWQRTPFAHRQRLKNCGVDCAHLLTGVYEPLGLIPIITVPEYSRDWFLHCAREDTKLYENLLDEHMVRVDEGKIGDVAGFRFGRCRVAHAGIIVSPDHLIAAYETNVRLVEWRRGDLADRLTGFWSPRCWHV